MESTVVSRPNKNKNQALVCLDQVVIKGAASTSRLTSWKRLHLTSKGGRRCSKN